MYILFSVVFVILCVVISIVVTVSMNKGSESIRGNSQNKNSQNKVEEIMVDGAPVEFFSPQPNPNPNRSGSEDSDSSIGSEISIEKKQTNPTTDFPSKSPTGFPWIGVGQTMEGLNIDDAMGMAIALSGDGKRIVVGANGNDMGSNPMDLSINIISETSMSANEQLQALLNGHAELSRGHVRVFEIDELNGDDGVWNQIGEDILAPPVQLDADDDADFGGLPYDLMGSAVAISADGLTIATGAPLADGGKGAVFCFRLNVDTNGTASWLPRGSHLPGNSYGDTPLDVSGYVSLSDDGNIVAVGEPAFASRSGRVRVYSWDTDDEDWKKVGKSLFSENLLDQFGYAVDLNGDGTRLVASAPNREAGGMELEFLETGHVRIYDLISSQWVVARDIMGDGTRDENFGRSVSISSDGNVVAIGAPNGFLGELLQPREGGSVPGSVAVYENLNEEWVLRGGSHIDIAEGFYFGHDVAVNADGSRVVASAMGFVMGGRVVSPSMVFTFDYVKDAGKDEGIWVQSGNSIYHGYFQNRYGEQFTDSTGFSVDISDNGEIVGVGSPFQINDDMQLSGHATVYQDPCLRL